uniref:Phage Tail Collar Domain n=1 Tax=Candidatus Kentrum sp. UNK TaxID=2126344 RepID=A0A451AYS4_9GAMM|nr:MAG: hypothetical protein BECKUNK1418G_GA0071005_104928 [Candidatus Kentron sp. UNK]VFK71184.1 MAG: hypothetical protein BECKUNK1418H_GA0071006_105328 [Candidatus Kentron sp. UNK]
MAGTSRVPGCIFRGKVGTHSDGKWALIPSESGQERTNYAKAPDLRGVFLRGLNKFDLDEPASKAVPEKQRNPDPRDDDFQGDNPGPHGHVYRGGRADDKSAIDYVHVEHTENGAWYSGDYQQTKERPTEKNPTGETRPKNVAVHYYIKIN